MGSDISFMKNRKIGLRILKKKCDLLSCLTTVHPFVCLLLCCFVSSFRLSCCWSVLCCFDYQFCKARRTFGNHFSVQIVLLSRATGSVSSGKLSTFHIISSKAREIIGDDVVTNENEVSCL